ncbi:MAG: Fic family protein [Acidobacteriota bacterium]|nr:Fic family protein [Acidobacteriota bacterium]
MNAQRETGEYIRCSAAADPFYAFVPKRLPPSPALQLDSALHDLMEKATLALGRLDGVTSLLPDTYLFTYFYVRKEAVLSSQIEGTQSTLEQLLLFENEQAPGVPVMDDIREVSSYVRAMQHGLSSIKSAAGLPLSLRLLKEIHGILLAEGRGSHRMPGEFRTSQNWVGGTKPSNAAFVGPPAELVLPCLAEFEEFLYDKAGRTPVLVKTALAHVQFETIHPFLDGNGRLGRLLITLLLCSEGALREPMLYLSLYFKTHRQEYYERLQRVREDGDWEGWLRFFLTGVLETAQQAVEAAQAILRLFDTDRKRIASLGRPANSALRVHEILQRRPIISVSRAAKLLLLSETTVRASLRQLEKLEIVREATGKDRNRLYIYDVYMSILDEGTKPIEAA